MNKKVLLLMSFIFCFGMHSFAQLDTIYIEVIDDKYSICEGDSSIIVVTPDGKSLSSISYFWSNKSGMDNIEILAPGKAKVKPIENDVFKVTVIENYWGDTISKSIPIGVQQKPIVYAGMDDSLCIDQQYTFNNANTDLQKGKYWEHNGQGTLLNETSQNPTYIPAKGENGKIRFIFKGISTYCEDVTDTVFLTYFPKPTANIITMNDSICSHETFAVNAEVLNADTFKWEIWPANSGKGYFENANTLNPTYIPNIKEYEDVNLILHAIGDGCIVSDTIILTVSQMFVEGPPDTMICFGDIINLSVTPSPGISYLWSTGETQNYIQIQPKITTEFTVEAWNSNGCYFNDTILVEVLESPVISINLDHENQTLIVEPNNLARYVFYGNNKAVLQDDIKNTFFYGGQIRELNDTIFVVAYNEFGCTNNEDDNYKDFMVLPMIKKVNAFSPNGDGINDLLMPGRKITVFDRTSKILYEGWDGWDGTFNGKNMPQGTYFYILYDEEGKLFYKGPVSIIR